MNIIEDERKIAQIGTCDNCKKEGVKVRRLEDYLSPLHYYNYCFECQRPTIKWRNKDGQIMISPINEEELLK